MVKGKTKKKVKKSFIEGIKIELKKVKWPSKKNMVKYIVDRCTTIRNNYISSCNVFQNTSV